MTITAHINIETQAGRRIVRELEKHRKLVQIDYPDIAGIENQPTYTLEESYKECEAILSKNYGVDVSRL
jgi:hypothetical protein